MDAPVDSEVTREIQAADLLLAYRAGVFPMADAANAAEVFWIDPPMRGIIPLEGFHVPASLRKSLKKRPFRVSVNAAFDTVIASCAQRTPVREDTWINAPIRSWFCELHRLGHAHSIECWDSAGRLAGGLYGLSIAGAFFGESMFSRVTDASKVALVHLVARLRARGFALLDTQFANPHLTQFGCIEIPRADYHSLLAGALSLSGVSFVDSSDVAASPLSGAGVSLASVPSGVLSCESGWDSVAGFLQSSTVTS